MNSRIFDGNFYSLNFYMLYPAERARHMSFAHHVLYWGCFGVLVVASLAAV